MAAYHSAPHLSFPAVRHGMQASESHAVIIRMTLSLWLDRWTQRRALARLDDRQLQDIGVSRRQAREESAKWFWQD